MKNSFVHICLLIVYCSACFGMSGMPGDEIPIPVDNFEAIVIDIDGVKTHGKNISFNGKTVAGIMRGATETLIPFEQISRLDFINNEEVITNEAPRVRLTVTLVDGSSFEASAAIRDVITGETSYGSFRLRADHVRSLEIVNNNTKLPE